MTNEVLKPFAKIFHLGHRCLNGLLEGEVEITEKIDGSQFTFGKINGKLMCRSKGKMIDMDNPDSLFDKAVEQVRRVDKLLPPNIVFWGEYLKKRKHNVIQYGNYPQNHIVLFGMDDLSQSAGTYTMDLLRVWSAQLGFDAVPVLGAGEQFALRPEFIDYLLNTDSYLGGHKIEGFVVKNWGKSVNLYDQIWWPMSGKYVSEKFKERHDRTWKDKKPKNNWESYKESYRTEARWEKAVQHLRDNGDLRGMPEDIGALMKAVQRDIIEEDQHEIREKLWDLFSRDLTKNATRGLPEWYKRKLAEGGIEV